MQAVADQFGVRLPHVMTFHALAHAIVHPDEDLLYDTDGDEKLARVVQQIVDEHLRDPQYMDSIRSVMLAHFRDDWISIVEGGYHLNQDELLRYRRLLSRQSMRGEYVKSFGEKVIADFLFEHDVPYNYERNHFWSGINYRPDFTLPTGSGSGVVIEYFGLAGDPDYDATSSNKRSYWAGKDAWSLLEFTPTDILTVGVQGFRALLKDSLESHGVSCVPLSEDALWLRIRDRAIDRFTRAVGSFIGRCRKAALAPSAIQLRLRAHVPLSEVEGRFIWLAAELYGANLHRLALVGEEDFDGLLQRAAVAVNTGHTVFQRRAEAGDIADLRYICVDEYQDFSELFYRLLTAVRQRNPSVELFCVGDDWQAINGFAGSDLRFFARFPEYYEAPKKLYLSRNYRSSQSIVAASNALMDGLGKPAVGHNNSLGTVVLADLAEFEPALVEQQRHDGDIITPVICRLAAQSLAADSDVVILCRMNNVHSYVHFSDGAKSSATGLDRYLEHVRSYFPEGLRERISISTVHKYKGLECQTVIVPDAVARSYPLIHPDWIFSRMFGDSVDSVIAEERRLLYVAMTRAKDRLVLITDRRTESVFISDVRTRYRVDLLQWDKVPPVSCEMSTYVVRICNQALRGSTPTYDLKDLLKACGYRWNSSRAKGWEKCFPAEGFNSALLTSELWSQSADGVEVHICDESGSAWARYLVDGGTWRCTFDRLSFRSSE